MARGRPRKVDPDNALDTAIKAFWQKGYDGTSMNDLVAATGMAKPGLYAAFGDKESLYARALTHYVQKLGMPLLNDLAQSPDPLDVVLKRFLGNVAAGAVDKRGPGGCFVVNSLVECAHQPTPLEEVGRTFDKKRRAVLVNRFRAAIRRELPPEGQSNCRSACPRRGRQSPGRFLLLRSSGAPALAVMGRAGRGRSQITRQGHASWRCRYGCAVTRSGIRERPQTNGVSA